MYVYCIHICSCKSNYHTITTTTAPHMCVFICIENQSKTECLVYDCILFVNVIRVFFIYMIVYLIL